MIIAAEACFHLMVSSGNMVYKSRAFGAGGSRARNPGRARHFINNSSLKLLMFTYAMFVS